MNCYYPTTFKGTLETIPGLTEDYYFIYNCLNTLEIETYNNRRGLLNYEIYSVKIKNTPDLIAKEVSIYAFR